MIVDHILKHLRINIILVLFIYMTVFLSCEDGMVTYNNVLNNEDSNQIALIKILHDNILLDSKVLSWDNKLSLRNALNKKVLYEAGNIDFGILDNDEDKSYKPFIFLLSDSGNWSGSRKTKLIAYNPGESTWKSNKSTFTGTIYAFFVDGIGDLPQQPLELQIISHSNQQLDFLDTISVDPNIHTILNNAVFFDAGFFTLNAPSKYARITITELSKRGFKDLYFGTLFINYYEKNIWANSIYNNKLYYSSVSFSVDTRFLFFIFEF